MSVPFDLKARLGGVQIWDWSDPAVKDRGCEINPLLCDVKLAFDEVYISYSTQSFLVGELSHYLYRAHQIALNTEVRARAREQIRAHAERILGEPWKLRDELDNVRPLQ